MSYSQINIGHGFKSGINNITITKAESWLHKKINNWNAFLWYISNYITIVDYGANWVKIIILSEKQREFFYKVVKKYDSDIEEYNFQIDKENDLWKSHKRNVVDNMKILERLIDN